MNKYFIQSIIKFNFQTYLHFARITYLPEKDFSTELYILTTLSL